MARRRFDDRAISDGQIERRLSVTASDAKSRPIAGTAERLLCGFFPTTINIATGLATLKPGLEDVLM
jgi:hypothetical protein